jgi:YggT family protein
MTYDDRPPSQPDPVDPPDETHVVERETYVERQVPPPPAAYTPPPAAYPPPQATSNVNVADSGPAYVDAGPGPLYYARRILSLLFGVLVTLLLLRIVLLLLVANPGNSIVDFIYSVTEPFVAPFRGMFQFDVVVSGDRALDIAALVALIGWTLIYALIMAILRLADRD